MRRRIKGVALDQVVAAAPDTEQVRAVLEDIVGKAYGVTHKPEAAVLPPAVPAVKQTSWVLKIAAVNGQVIGPYRFKETNPGVFYGNPLDRDIGPLMKDNCRV